MPDVPGYRMLAIGMTAWLGYGAGWLMQATAYAHGGWLLSCARVMLLTAGFATLLALVLAIGGWVRPPGRYPLRTCLRVITGWKL